MSFGDEIRLFAEKIDERSQAALVKTAELALESIQDGSPITGAPGQPVDTGFLKASWQVDFPEPGVAVVFTNTEYAPYIEEGGDTGLTLRSAVGGFGSVKLTRANFDRVVETAVDEVRG